MEKAKRYTIFIIGLFINSLGVSFITKADLGTSPISSIPYVLSLNFPFSLGIFTIFFSILLIVLQLFILRKNFKSEHLLQIPISIAFGYFIDFTMILLNNLTPSSYLSKIVALLIGCLILGFGVYLEVLANVAMLPGESFVRVVSDKWKFEFGTTKIVFDVSMTVIAALLSFGFAYTLNGVREGTVIAAVLVGFMARTFRHVFKKWEKLLYKKTPEFTASNKIEKSSENPVWIIAIGRQYGSGGSDIGKQLAKRLGFAFYDRDIIKMTAGTTRYSEKFIERNEESMTNSLLYDLANAYSAENNTPKDKVFEAESSVLCELAKKNSCVIAGRMSDYILKDYSNCISIFLHTSIKNRIDNLINKYNISEKEAKEKIVKEDKKRAGNYHYYTNRIWGFAGNYDISVDTALGIDIIEHMIREIMQKKQDEI